MGKPRRVQDRTKEALDEVLVALNQTALQWQSSSSKGMTAAQRFAIVQLFSGVELVFATIHKHKALPENIWEGFIKLRRSWTKILESKADPAELWPTVGQRAPAEEQLVIVEIPHREERLIIGHIVKGHLYPLGSNTAHRAAAIEILPEYRWEYLTVSPEITVPAYRPSDPSLDPTLDEEN